ncbi:AMP-binding protein [Microbulbifer elongatus]|uniref:AMP-binding protein n=1 Tax=Microbulbifer elongatus TaxID=86173 RepID=UPI0039A49F1A
MGNPFAESFEPELVSIEDHLHIFFTSGTTGRAKGVVSTHRNLARGMSSSAFCMGSTLARESFL